MEEKKNNSKNIIIAILTILVVLLGGFIVYDKVINNKETKDNENVIEKIKDNTENFDLTVAKKLIDKYYLDSNCLREYNIFEHGMTNGTKNFLAMIKVPEYEFNRGHTSCGQIDGAKYNEEGECVEDKNGMLFNTEGSEVEYDILNYQYKELFGKKENVTKENISFDRGRAYWKYNRTSNSFIAFSYPIGCGGYEPYYRQFFVKSADENNGELKIKVGYVHMKYVEEDNDTNETFVSTTIKGEKVTYNYSDIEKETFKEEFKKKYLDKLDTYEFSFKFEDDHYVFVDLKKID